MQVTIQPSKISGSIYAPASKSSMAVAPTDTKVAPFAFICRMANRMIKISNAITVPVCSSSKRNTIPIIIISATNPAVNAKAKGLISMKTGFTLTTKKVPAK